MQPAGIGVPSASLIAGELRTLLATVPFAVWGALVYGSVAKGRHHAGSDVDAMVFVEDPLSSQEMGAFVTTYETYQYDLGLEPDPKYPVEVFDLATCRRVLGIAGHAATGGQRCSPEDAWEILYALVTPHLVVTGDEVVAELRAAADDRCLQLASWASEPGW